MLILSRRKGEEIVIGETIRVVVADIRDGKCKLAIEAPKDVRQRDGTHRCNTCDGWFDGRDANEGGDYFTDPTRRLEVQEERQRRRRKA